MSSLHTVLCFLFLAALVASQGFNTQPSGGSRQPLFSFGNQPTNQRPLQASAGTSGSAAAAGAPIPARASSATATAQSLREQLRQRMLQMMSSGRPSRSINPQPSMAGSRPAGPSSTAGETSNHRNTGDVSSDTRSAAKAVPSNPRGSGMNGNSSGSPSTASNGENQRRGQIIQKDSPSAASAIQQPRENQSSTNLPSATNRTTRLGQSFAHQRGGHHELLKKMQEMKELLQLENSMWEKRKDEADGKRTTGGMKQTSDFMEHMKKLEMEMKELNHKEQMGKKEMIGEMNHDMKSFHMMLFKILCKTEQTDERLKAMEVKQDYIYEKIKMQLFLDDGLDDDVKTQDGDSMIIGKTDTQEVEEEENTSDAERESAGDSGQLLAAAEEAGGDEEVEGILRKGGDGPSNPKTRK